MKEKVWGIVVQLTTDDRPPTEIELQFDDGVWNYILDESVKTGINTIILESGSGIKFASHPELATKGAWSRKRVRTEAQRCRDLGIALIPKLNFSTAHDLWLGEYAKMVSTTTYYQVCNDLIQEVYRLFGHPEYIHLGFDEEDARHVKGYQLAIYRQKELFWHDLSYLMDCVADTGARPWIWSCPLFRYDDRVEIHDSIEASSAMHFFGRMHLPDARTGYFVRESPYQPLSDDRKTVSLRFGSMMETVTADVPMEVEYAPCVDRHNRMNYSQVLIRKHFAKQFQEKTVFRYDRLR